MTGHHPTGTVAAGGCATGRTRRSRRAAVAAVVAVLAAGTGCAGSGGEPLDVAALLSPASRNAALPPGGATSSDAAGGPATAAAGSGSGSAASSLTVPSAAGPTGAAAGSPTGPSSGSSRPGQGPAGAGGATAPTRPGGSGGAASPAAPGSPAPTAGTGPTTTPGPGPVPERGSGSTRAPGAHPGVTDTTITLGIPVLVNYDNVVAGFASKRQSVGDMRAQAQAVINEINATGGMAGRQVAPVFHEWDSGDGTFASQAQKTCAALTEDHKVFAVTPQTYAMDTLAACLARRDTVLVGSGDIGGWADQAMLDRYERHLYMPNWLNFSRWSPIVDSLAEQGYFPGGARVGLLYLDQPIYQGGVSAIEAGLARRGVTLADKQAIPFPDGTSGVADLAAPVANAVLRFRSRNIDHVMFVEGVALIAFLFMPQAESQGYRPRYGLTSGDQPSWLIYNTPKTQWTGAVGMGFLPQNDVDAPQDPGGNPTRERCLGIFARGGVDATKDRFREHSALGICGNLLFLKAALDRAPEVSTRGLQLAVDGLGSSFLSPLSFATRLGARRHDGAAALRPFAYDPACACTRYTGPPRPVP